MAHPNTPSHGWMPSRRHLIASAGAVLAAPWVGARAQGKIAGGKPIALVVSYPPGGGADLMARILAPKLEAALGQTVVVENKAGASGQLAAGHVARAAADGSVLLLDASSFAVNPSLFPKLPYDTATAFTPLAVLATFPNVLVCTPGFEAKSVKDVIRLAKAGPLNYASSGTGSAQHLAGALFEQRAGVSLTHVAYRGGGPAMNDVIGGQVPLFFANVASSLGHIQSGRLRPLAVTSALRARSLPEVPTMAEAGVAGYEVLEWNPVLAPAGLPADTKATLVAGIRRALEDAEVLGRIRQLGGDVFADASQQSAGKFIAAQQALWAKVIKERKITAG
ncbi:MAG: tripartite tricarboxylate transporter substrate binding protein [Hydrogenophaga sp.]|uniref:tripartite tricarboxylate transporter substrate binding protein n=1 Tax=Hydrogenophaga sp. TaxID=1904254 RepID=UPI00169B27EA|nr:tripartite tricarboxylate transporter substrate binding protein [Hydrogenophaga sp.]NIM43773.1 tripartite tricarboxylate transporter substrate binding protein [Hydrogenophaga sp.]NIN28839.1 tripartite tricarboxylate transporter substrate binding protein [Hydrogenophaga sp.]NIN33298.1 tripartite tricarboxylate transporter substrate binding protein [Hydrogenophaga sp.]NIN57973.1 tripartite tricarboxylate transporter substrate binding protein [Hydrogenophaga sp.]NIO54271.1 tripartite tricarbox